MRAYVYMTWDQTYKITKQMWSNVPARVVELAPGEYERIVGHWDDHWKQGRLRKLWEAQDD